MTPSPIIKMTVDDHTPFLKEIEAAELVIDKDNQVIKDRHGSTPRPAGHGELANALVLPQRIIKVKAEVVIELEPGKDGEDACTTLERGAAQQLRGFPDGDIIEVHVHSFEPMPKEEIEERGYTE